MKTFKILFLLVTFTMNCQLLKAQNPLVKQWDKRFGATAVEELFAFQQTGDGGYILGGNSFSGISGDKTQASQGQSDYWVVKVDSVGTLQWEKRFGGALPDALHSLQQTSDGGYILGGYSGSGISGDKTQACVGDNDYWIVKIDSLGIKQWDKTFGGIDNDALYALQQTIDGGYMLAGFSGSGISGDKTQPLLDTCVTCVTRADYWIVKIDAAGTKQWDKDFGGLSNDNLHAMQQTTDGGYLLGGYTASGIGGDKTQPIWGANDFWIVKTDSLGNKQWDKDFGGTLGDYLFSLQQTMDAGFIFGGTSFSDVGGDKTQPSWGTSDYWIVKTDSIGTVQWDKDLGAVSLEDDFGNISQTADSGYLIAGTSYSIISGNKTENNLGVEQSWIIKTNALGIIQWDKTIFTQGHDEKGLAIQTKDGCYAIANYTDGGTGGYKSQPSWGNSDYWIVKFCDTTQVIVSIPGINLSCTDTTFCEKQCIDFYDLSTNNPTSWQWFFPGADSLSSTLQNPTNICYNNYGSFDVTLIACNAAGCDTLMLTNFINEYQSPIDSIYQSNDTLYSLPAFSYQWYEVTNGIIAGATNQYYVPTQAGNYYCSISDSIGCIAASNTIAITTGIGVISQNDLLILKPNPFSDNLTIILTQNKPVEINLYDVTGRKVFNQTINHSATLNTSQLAKGIYIYEVRSPDASGGGVIKKGKVVKE
ncbi:MAG: T9SS type A sorting domain-containing protein [Bacteroidia bacterium]